MKHFQTLPLRVPKRVTFWAPNGEGLRDCPKLKRCPRTRAQRESNMIAALRINALQQICSGTRAMRARGSVFFQAMTTPGKYKQTSSPAQLLANQLVVGRERLGSYPRVDFRHHSVLAHLCGVWHGRRA